MTRDILTHVGTALFGFIGGYIVGYTGTIRLVLATLNKAIREREDRQDIGAQLELPGLTLFRSIVRLRRF